jgi:hypothetical protein
MHLLQINTISARFAITFMVLVCAVGTLSSGCTSKDHGDIQLKLSVGPAGGRIDGPLGLRLHVPPEALPFQTEFIIRISPETYPNSGRESVSKQLILDTNPVTAFDKPLLCRLTYADQDLGEREATVFPWRYDGNVVWERVSAEGMTRNEDNDSVHFQIDLPGIYALFVE